MHRMRMPLHRQMQTGKSRRSSRPPWPRATVLALIGSDGVNMKADQMRHSAQSVSSIGWRYCRKPSCGFSVMDLRRGNRKKVNGTTDERPDDRAVYADVLQIAAQNQFEAVRDGPRIPVSNDFGN